MSHPLSFTQKQAAEDYATGLEFKDGLITPRSDVDWPAKNRAVVERWGIAGLRRVKAIAWKLVATREGVMPGR